MTQGDVSASIDGAIAYIVINNPGKRNALSLEMWAAIPRLIARFSRLPSVKVLCLTGAGDSAFASGMEIGELSHALKGREGVTKVTRPVEDAQLALMQCSKPVVAVIKGNCVGGGLELAIACDIRIASDTASFVAAPAKLGLVYSMITTRALVQLVGPGNARDLLFTGRSVSSTEALRLGLAQQLIADRDIDRESRNYLEMLCSRSQFSIHGAKKAVSVAVDPSTEAEREFEQVRAQAFSGVDFSEGLEAFQEKRLPNFAWRSQ